MHEHVALVLVRQEAGRHLAAEERSRRRPQTTSMTNATALLRISAPDQRTITSVARPNMRLNQSKNRRSSPWLSVFGLSSSAASAGLSVSALNAERITEIAMVTANC